MDDPWTVAEAKAKLSEVIEKALAGEPQAITRNGKSAVVVVAASQWARRVRQPGTLLDFFMNSPIRSPPPRSLVRFPGQFREVDLGSISSGHQCSLGIDQA